jgi:iron complex outermembrane receptor protein
MGTAGEEDLMKLKTFSAVSGFALMAALSAPAYAEQPATTSNTQGPTSTSDATGTTDAQAAAAVSENRTADIVVTAEFREARLQDTPIAITAVNAEMLEARGATDVSAVASKAPNVTLKPQPQGGGAGLIAFIRGVGQTDFIYARDPGVGLYIDDVYIPTLQSSLIELMDLDRIEVLRGPQGTLAGKNSIGGSIRLFGKKPRGDGTGSIEVAYGSFNDIKVRGYADIGLSDNLAVRFSGLARQTDGYVQRIDYALTHPTSNVPVNESIGRRPLLGEMGGRQLLAGRIALNWDPTPNLNIYLTADITNQDGDPGPAVLLAAGRPGNPFDPRSQTPAVDTGGSGTPWLRGKNGQAVTIGCQFVPAGIDSCDTPPAGYDPRFIAYANYLDAMSPTITAPFKPYFADPHNTFEGWGVHGTVTLDISSAAQLVWISSYRKYESTWAEDQDITPVGESQLNNINRHWAWSQELRLNFDLADKLITGTVGGFYFKQYGEYEARVDLNYVAAGGPPSVAAPIDFIHGPDQTPSESKAVFANISLHPTEALTITGGVRYSDEKKDYTYFRRNPDYTAPDAAICATPPLPFTGVRLTSNCGLLGFLGLTPPGFAGTRLDYRGVIDYRFSDALLVYASISTGFKGGGVNPRPFFAVQAAPFNPETLTTYEIGFKSDFFGRRMRLNGAAFWNKYNDIQGTKLTCPEYGPIFQSPCLRPDNVGSGEVKGFELETQIFPVDGLSLDGSLSYINFKYTSAVAANGHLVNTNCPASAITPYTPEWTWSVGAQYDYHLTGGSTVSARLDGNYQDDLFTTSENSPRSHVPSYFLANARLAYTAPDDDWQVYLEVKNLFDKYYFNSIQDASSTLGIVSAQPGLPRTWLVGVKKNFGPSHHEAPPAYVPPPPPPPPVAVAPPPPPAPVATYKQCLDNSVVRMDQSCPPPPAPVVPRTGERG